VSHRRQRESPDAVDSMGSLRASLAVLAPVLTSPVFVYSVAPFSPTRTGWFDSLCGWD